MFFQDIRGEVDNGGAGNRSWGNMFGLPLKQFVQCVLSAVDQLRGMKGHSTGQYDVLWVLSAPSQMCSGIDNNQIPLLQVLNDMRKCSPANNKKINPHLLSRMDSSKTFAQ